MFAVVEIAGKQLIVAKGSIISVNKLPLTEKASSFTSDKVLAIFKPDGSDVEVGKPYLQGKSVSFKVLESEVKDEKIVGAKWQRRKRHLKIFGHRQIKTRLEVTKVG